MKRGALDTIFSILALLMAIVFVYLSCGCTVATSERAFVASSVADLMTTGVGLEAGLHEGIPLIDTGHKWSTLVVAAAWSVVVYLAGHEAGRRGERKLALWIFNVGSAVRFTAAANNIRLIEQKE